MPDPCDLRKQCLSLHHDTPYAGHLGRDRTKASDYANLLVIYA